MEGWITRVDWEQGENNIGGGPRGFDPCQGLIVLHPTNFLRSIQEMYGTIAALDMLKILTRDKIDFEFKMNRSIGGSD